MPNISFGQNSDPSALFGQLNRYYLEDQEALLRRAADREKERQDAEDKDTFDKWKNGLISDDDWLAYIARRVEESKGDEKENQAWVELQREYTVAIADDKAEFQYANGEISINQLIAYYEGRRKGLNKDSQEWREVTLKINEYVDKAAAADITAGAQDIADRIAVGAASLGDLKAYYEGKLKGLRKNSPLYEQISAEIRDLQSQLVTGGGGYRTSGGGGGGGGNGGMSSAEAYDFATNSGFIQPDEVLREKAYRDERGVSRDAANFSGFIPGLTEAETDDWLDAQSTYYKNILSQWSNGNTAIDPATGERLEGTPDQRRAYAFALIDSLEMRRIAKLTGNKIDESEAEDYSGDIVEAVSNYILPANAMRFEDEAMPIIERQLQNGMDQLERTSNFGGTTNLFAGAIQSLTRLVQRTTRERTRFLETENESPVGEKYGGWKPLYEQLPEDTLNYLNEYVNGLATLAGGNPEAAAQWLEEHSGQAEFNFLTNQDTGIVTRGYNMQTTARALMSGEATLVYDGLQGGVVAVPQTVRPELSPEPFLDYRAAGIDFDERAGDELVNIIVDGPGGKPMPVLAVARMVSPPHRLALYSKVDKRFLSSSEIQSLGSSGIQEQLNSGDLETRPAASFLSVSYTTDSGRQVTMYRSQNGGWSGRPEFNVEDLTLGFVGASPSGELGKRVRPFAHTRMVPTPYFGDNARELQAMIDRGEIDPKMLFIGPDGMPTGELVDLTGWYYDDTFQKKGYSYADPELADFRREKSLRTWQTRSGMLEGSDMQNAARGTSPAGRTFGGSFDSTSAAHPNAMFEGLRGFFDAIGVLTSDYYGGNRPIWRPFAGSNKAGGGLEKQSLTERYANFRPAPGDVRRANAARAASDALPKITLPKPNTKPISSLAKLPGVTTPRIVSRETLALRAGITPTQKAVATIPKPALSKTTTTVSKTPTPTRTWGRTPSRY